MAAIGLATVYLTRTYCFQPGSQQVAINDMHWRCSAVTGGGANETDFAIALDALLAPKYKNLLSNSADYVGVQAVRVYPGAYGLPVASQSLRGAGLVAGVPLPSQCTSLLQKRTAAGGKKGRGRMYIPFPAGANNNAGGDPDGPYLALMAVIAGVYQTPLTVTPGPTSSTMQPIVFNKPTGGQLDVVLITAATRWATQRRRGQFGRTNPSPI